MIEKRRIGGDDAIDRLTQPRAVEMPGQFIVIGQVFGAARLCLAITHRADDAEHLLRPPVSVAQRLPALMHPGKFAGGVAQPVFTIEIATPIEMGRKHGFAVTLVVGMNVAGEKPAGCDPGGKSRSAPA